MKSSEVLFEIPFGGKTISASFDGGSLSSDGGLLLPRQVDKKLGLTRRLADSVFRDFVGASPCSVPASPVFGLPAAETVGI